MNYKFPLNIVGIPNVTVVKVKDKYQVQGRADETAPWVNAGGLHDTVDEALDFSEQHFGY